MRILIIGATGFIGKHCFDYFISKNEQVFGCDIQGKDNDNYFVISDSDPDFNSVFKKCKPEVIINASGSADVGFSINNPEKDHELNVRNVERILDAIKLHVPTCRLINFSSAAIYGNPQYLPIKESHQAAPLSPYGFHKLESEQLLKKYHENEDLKTCSLRIFSAYGKGLKKQIFWDIYQKATLQETVQLFGTGNESRDFIYIDDLVVVIDLIIQKAPFCGESINVANGQDITISKATQLLLNELNCNKPIYFSGQVHQGYPSNWIADITVLKNLGYKQSIFIEDGIKKYAKWLIEKE